MAKFESNGGITVETVHQPIVYVITLNEGGVKRTISLSDAQARLLVSRVKSALNFENPAPSHEA